MCRKTIVAVLALLTVASIATGAQTTYRSDEDREAKLLSDLEHLEIEDIQVDIRGPMATISGTTDSLFHKQQATEMAKRIPRVEVVVNNISVVTVEDSAALEQSILDQLKKDRHYTMYDLVELSVDGGVVTLTGCIAPGGDPKEIETTVSKVTGVSRIEDKLRLLPYSATDERLREAIATAVLDALGAERLADTELHVVVENGHVTLAGIVRDDEESDLVEKAARQTEGTLSVANLLEVEQPSTARMRMP
jgi:osmotically-inducible protein OsmY